MDLCEHLLAKGFGRGVSEYEEMAPAVGEERVLNSLERVRFKSLAGYRNRMVHFCHEISDRKLFEIYSFQLTDIIYVI